jgi:hypothetical protein
MADLMRQIEGGATMQNAKLRVAWPRSVAN